MQLTHRRYTVQRVGDRPSVQNINLSTARAVTDAVCGFIRPRKVAPAKHDAAEIIWREVGSDTPTDDAAIATMRMSQGVMRLMAKI